MSVENLLTKIKQQPERVEFSEVMEVIAQYYQYQPTTFNNDDLVNLAGTNEGSCKVFSFAQLNALTVQQTLACFGTYYRDDVLKNPTGDDHGNIRRFMRSGWQGIHFSTLALTNTLSKPN